VITIRIFKRGRQGSGEFSGHLHGRVKTIISKLNFKFKEISHAFKDDPVSEYKSDLEDKL
jgi:hypothetical protein